jgi:hypothetical protein
MGGVDDPADLASARAEIDRLRQVNAELIERWNAAQAGVAEAVILFQYIHDGDDFSAILEGVEAYIAKHAPLTESEA